MDAMKAAIHKLKQTNWLHQKVDEQSVDDVAKQVIETVDTTNSTMLVKANKDDVSEFQSYTICTLNKKLPTTSDIEQYKLLSVKEILLTILSDFLMSCAFLSCFRVADLESFTLAM